MPFPVAPPANFFKKPDDLVPGFGTTVTDDGHIYGYLALFNARLIGSGRKNTQPPRSRCDYNYANAYTTVCDDGSKVRTGVIAGDGGHTRKGGFKPTQEAYADTSRQVARVVYGEDQHGVWFTGALCPEVDDATVAKVRGSAVSGHWERPAAGRPHELLGSCLVNIPGFAQAADHRIVASASFTPSGGITIRPEISDGDAAAEEKRGGIDTSSIMAAGNSITAAAVRLVPVSGVLAALGTPTVDGRQVNAVQWGDLPLPLWYKRAQGGWGHDGAVVVGTIDEITIEGQLVKYKGMVEEGITETTDAQDVANLGVLGVSMDGRPAEDAEVIYEYDEYGWPNKVIFELYEIYGATLTSDPAFKETMGQVIGENGGEELPAPEDAAGESGTPAEGDSVEAAAAVEPEYTTIKLPIHWH